MHIIQDISLNNTLNCSQ